jgi:hypothetical protein
MVKKLVIALAIITTALSVPASAQESSQKSSQAEVGFGLRAGASITPDQFVLGGQFSWGKEYSIFRLVPSVDVGFGSSITTIAFNGDLIFNLKVEGSNFGFYGGAGPTILYLDADGSNSSWELGLSVVAGAHMPFKKLPPTNLEFRFGVGDVPDLKILLIMEF